MELILQIEAGAFIATDQAERVRTILGYPIQAIRDAIRQATRALGEK